MKRLIWLIVTFSMVMVLQACACRPPSPSPSPATTPQPTEESWDGPRILPTPTVIFPIPGIQDGVIFNQPDGLTLFDPRSGYNVLTKSIPYPAWDMAMSPDGMYFAVYGERGIYLSEYPFSTFKLVVNSLNDRLGIVNLSFSPDSKKLAYSQQDGLSIRDLDTNSDTLALPYTGRMLDETDWESEMSYSPSAWSPDGRWLIVNKVRLDYVVHLILDTSTLQVYELSNNRQDLAWLPDNSGLVAVVDYDCMAMTGFEDGIFRISINSGSLMETRIWSEGTEPECGERSYSITGIDPEGKRIYFNRYSEIGDTSSPPQMTINYEGQPVEGVTGDCYSLQGLTILADGRWLCESSGRIYAYDPIQYTEETLLEWPRTSMTFTKIPKFLSPDRSWLIVQKDNQFILLDLISSAHRSSYLAWANEYTQMFGWIELTHP